MFSREQHSHLEALGYVLYEARNVVASKPTSDSAAASGFWQTALGRNIAGFVQNADITQLRIPSAMPSAQAKRALWRQIKTLRQV